MTRNIFIQAIQISPDRQRREFDQGELQALAESIKSHGLFHPVCLRKEGDKMFLVSGERRLRAMQDIYDLGGSITHGGETLSTGLVPYNDLGELDELVREEAECEENLRRKDLTWQESANATARIAALRAKQAAAKGEPPPTVLDITREIRGIPSAELQATPTIFQEPTRREIIVAKHLDDPEVKGAKSLDAAFKVLKRKEETERNVQLAATIGRTFTADVHTLLNDNSMSWIKAQPPEQFDVILTDPPYGMGADEFGDSSGKAEAGHHYNDSLEYWKQLMAVFAPESYRVAKAQAHLYVFCDFDRFHQLKGLLDLEGWDVHRTPLIWHNPTSMRLPWVERGPQRKWQMILYAMKGRKLVTRIFPDLVTYPSDENVGHAAQKPVQLLVDLLKRSVVPGNTVLDPFAGSGSTIIAAHELKCRCTGVELSEASYGVAAKRLEELKANSELAGL